MTKNSWELAGSIAKASRGNLQASIDLTKPGTGLHVEFGQTSPCSLRIFGVEHTGQRNLDAARGEFYARGSDLVATYEEFAPDRLRTQIYWRALEPAEIVVPKLAGSVAWAFDLVLSVNTSLLDSDPQVTVRGSIQPAASVAKLGGTNSADSILGRLRDPSLSYLEMVHPVDACQSWIDPSEDGQSFAIRHSLFQQRLEKGVILRARIRAALVSREDDEAVALALYDQFAASEPPLTV